MLFKIGAYLRFLKKSHNQHGIHSPFVYDFITKCLYNRTAKSDYQGIRKELKKLYFSENPTLNRKQTKLLIQIIGYFNPDWLLNFSRKNGLIAGTLNPKNKREVFQISNYSSPKTSTANLIKTGYNDLMYISEELSNAFFSVHKKPFCLVLLNEDHLRQGLPEFLETALDSFSSQSIIILEGINNSKEKEALWKKIKNLNEVSVTVDLFFWGIIFLRKGQAKQHFKVRV